MGLIRQSRPTSNHSFGGTWLQVGKAQTTAWDTIDDLSGTYTVRGSGGGVETSFANDAEYIYSIYGAFASECLFNFAPICGDDDLISLKFHMRKILDNGLDGSTVTLLYRVDTTPFVYSLGSPTLVSGYDYLLTSTLNPVTNAPWTTDTLSAGAVFGIRVISNSPFSSGTIQVSRFYIEAPFGVGPTLGRDYREDNWRYCDVCGLKCPYNQIQRPQAIHPQAGLAVCLSCYDQPDHDTIKAMGNKHPRDEQDLLY
jgi:hypothetical protein